MNCYFHVEVFWVVTPCSVMVRYKRFGGPCCLNLQVEVFWVVTPSILPEDGGSMDLRKIGILPQHHTASQPRRPQPVSITIVKASKLFDE